MAKKQAKKTVYDAKGFIGSLFDFTFSSFITVKLVRFLFGAGIILGGLGVIITIITSFSQSIASGLLSLIISPIAYLLGIIALRIWLELVIIMFKIEENVR